MKKIIGLLLMLVLAANTVFAQTIAPAPKPRVADKTFWILAVGAYGSAVADEEITQHYLAHGKFHEANPLLGQTRKTAYPVLFGLTTSSVVSAYLFKRSGSKYWWVSPVITYNIHAFAIGYNIRLGRRH